MGWMNRTAQWLEDAVEESEARKARAAGTPPPPTPGVKVKTYRSNEEYARNAPDMIALGWRVESVVAKIPKVAVGRTAGKAVLTGGIGLLLSGRSRKNGEIVVTWVRP